MIYGSIVFVMFLGIGLTLIEWGTAFKRKERWLPITFGVFFVLSAIISLLVSIFRVF